MTESHGGYHVFEQAINEDGDALGAHFESRSNQNYPAPTEGPRSQFYQPDSQIPHPLT